MKTYLTFKYILFAIVVSMLQAPGCNSRYLDEDMAILEEAPNAGQAYCRNTVLGAYNLSMGSWSDSTDIEYYISGTPYGISRDETRQVIGQAFSMWGEQIEKPALETSDSAHADIVIKFDYIDGKGGTLGMSSFPPAKKGQPSVLLTFDKYDVNGVNGGSPYDFFSVALHEAGHSIGLRHSENEKAVMWPSYQNTQLLNIDDVLAAKVQYRVHRSFAYLKHNYVYITQDDRHKVGQFFRANEFFTKCKDYDQPHGHFIDSLLIEGLDFIRMEVGAPVRIVSTYRPDACNRSVGGARFSQHLYCNAVDFVIGSRAARDKFMSEIEWKGCIYRTLVAMGIRGIGAYPQHNGLHIDTRDQAKVSEWGPFNPIALTDESCFN